MPARLNRLFRKPCLHEETIVVLSAHVERRVCESCGYLSFTMRSEPSPDRISRRNPVLQTVSGYWDGVRFHTAGSAKGM